MLGQVPFKKAKLVNGFLVKFKIFLQKECF